MVVEYGGAHACIMCELFYAELLIKVLFHPANSTSHLVAMAFDHGYLLEPFTLFPHQESIINFLLDERKEKGDVLRSIEQF